MTTTAIPDQWGRILTFAYAGNVRRRIFSIADKMAETYLSYAGRLLLCMQASKLAKDNLLAQLKLVSTVLSALEKSLRNFLAYAKV